MNDNIDKNFDMEKLDGSELEEASGGNIPYPAPARPAAYVIYEIKYDTRCGIPCKVDGNNSCASFETIANCDFENCKYGMKAESATW